MLTGNFPCSGNKAAAGYFSMQRADKVDAHQEQGANAQTDLQFFTEEMYFEQFRTGNSGDNSKEDPLPK